MLKPGWKVSGHSFSALEIARKSFVHSPPISWRLWITTLRAVDGFSGKDRLVKILLLMLSATLVI
jgi:hypothetical protein